MGEIKRYCLTVDLRAGVRLPDHKLNGLLTTDEGEPIPAQEARDLMFEKIKEGYTVLPMCDNHNEKGYCKGHPV